MTESCTGLGAAEQPQTIIFPPEDFTVVFKFFCNSVFGLQQTWLQWPNNNPIFDWSIFYTFFFPEDLTFTYMVNGKIQSCSNVVFWTAKGFWFCHLFMIVDQSTLIPMVARFEDAEMKFALASNGQSLVASAGPASPGQFISCWKSMPLVDSFPYILFHISNNVFKFLARLIGIYNICAEGLKELYWFWHDGTAHVNS